MTRADLLALAQRVEREEPSQELRRTVLVACGWTDCDNDYDDWRAPDGGVYRDHYPLHSLDAAASLVPPGWSYTVGTNEIRKFAMADLGRSYPTNARVTAEHATPAAALTAAALRARAMEVKDDQ